MISAWGRKRRKPLSSEHRESARDYRLPNDYVKAVLSHNRQYGTGLASDRIPTRERTPKGDPRRGRFLADQ